MSEMREIIVPWAPLCREPRLDNGLETQLLFGETFTVTGMQAGWCKGVATRDGYEGFVPRAALTSAGPAPTHKVIALRTPVYKNPDHKSASEVMLSFLSTVRVVDEQGWFMRVPNLGWIAKEHLATTNSLEPDYVATALRFTHTPYLWGGRTSLGLDCSALVQLALQAAGMDCPRNAVAQQAALGQPLEGGIEAASQRGDLLFIAGVHVAIFTDTGRVINAHAGEGRYFNTFEQDLHELLTDFTHNERAAAVVHRFERKSA